MNVGMEGGNRMAEALSYSADVLDEGGKKIKFACSLTCLDLTANGIGDLVSLIYKQL